MAKELQEVIRVLRAQGKDVDKLEMSLRSEYRHNLNLQRSYRSEEDYVLSELRQIGGRDAHLAIMTR